VAKSVCSRLLLCYGEEKSCFGVFSSKRRQLCFAQQLGLNGCASLSAQCCLLVVFIYLSIWTREPDCVVTDVHAVRVRSFSSFQFHPTPQKRPAGILLVA
jgi:hypothetical protein